MLSPTQPRRKERISPAHVTRRAWDWTAAALVLAVALGVMILALASVWLYSRYWVLAGVRSLGVPLGSLSRRAAAARLEQAWLEQTIALWDGEREWAAAASELGLGLDTGATVSAALRAGRSGPALWAWLRGTGPIDLPPVIVVDEAAAARYLERLAPQVALVPSDARIRVREGQAQTVPAAPGRELDVVATAGRLQLDALSILAQGRLELSMISVPPVVDDADLSALVAQANGWLSNTLVIRAYDPIRNESLWWTAPPAVWDEWALLAVIPPGADPAASNTLQAALAPDRVSAYLSAHAAALAPERFIDLDQAVPDVVAAAENRVWDVHIRVYHHPSQHVVQAGETLASIARDHGFPYPWLQQANPGVEALHPGQVVAIPSPDVLLPLPVVVGKRIVVSISEQSAVVYEWDRPVWTWTVSTGIDSSPTSPGVFQVQEHVENAYAASWDLWMPYFVGIYRPVPGADFMNGFHGFPTRDGANLLWTGNLGYPVTYGCILLSTENAAALFEWAQEGVVVEIRP